MTLPPRRSMAVLNEQAVRVLGSKKRAAKILPWLKTKKISTEFCCIIYFIFIFLFKGNRGKGVSYLKQVD
jgi:hypothetical protein